MRTSSNSFMAVHLVFVGLAPDGQGQGVGGGVVLGLDIFHRGAVGEVGGGENGGSDDGDGGDGADDGLFHGGASFLEIKINLLCSGNG